MAATGPLSLRFSYLGRRLNTALGVPCALCTGVAPGGVLCPGCTSDVQYSMLHHPWRCPRCALALPAEGPCPDCADQTPSLEKVIAAFDYVHPADSLILRYKNARQFHLASAFAALAQNAIRHESQRNGIPPWPPRTPLIPIPGSAHSLRRRGFNPAGEFASQLGRLMNMPVWHTLLYREPDHLKQSTLNRRQRRANTAHLYYCARNIQAPCAVLVDDVLTTGNTLHTAAQALIAAGVQRVFAVAIARTPYVARDKADGIGLPDTLALPR
ncbi:ComF family protein [Advenella mimigardefordensis]|uniref:Phosphoribosyltransferase domain-containing protein n=1 Tax=Advenella mimigardefordensis (strain DSM 17166 / LMG 22922 / DPN7) TaxID=1247726 RepID=W0P7K6_ADVMD|nr:ComF family protein [Advenella mimigardefordensis]AHG62834.1 phosphoribosyltransferase domain-containing protein [Advenella mimigardefordensis DPN7]